MYESGVYGAPDLDSFSGRVEQLRTIVREDTISGKHPAAMTTILERKLNACGAAPIFQYLSDAMESNVTMPAGFFLEDIVNSMKESLSELSEELFPIHQKLVLLRRQLVALGAKPKPPKAELKVLQEELRKIDAYVPYY